MKRKVICLCLLSVFVFGLLPPPGSGKTTVPKKYDLVLIHGFNNRHQWGYEFLNCLARNWGSGNVYVVYSNSSMKVWSMPVQGKRVIMMGAKNHQAGNDSIEKQLLAKWSEVGNYNLQIVPYSGRTTRLIDFENGKVDATVDMDITIQPEDDMVPLACIGKSDYYLALSKNRGDLLQELNNALQNIDTTQPAFTKNLADKYFSDMAVSSKLTNSETAWLKNHSVIRVGYFNNYLPFSDTRDDGTATGIISRSKAFL